MTKYNKPRVTGSKKNCKCAETGKTIKKWEDVLVIKDGGVKVYCLESNKYKEYIAQLAANNPVLKNAETPNF